jgi:hypothetical protein
VDVDDRPITVRRMGKTGEECAELLAVTTRIAIQGIDEIDPGTQKTNRQRLIEEIGDVYAQLDANMMMLCSPADREFVEARRHRKLGYTYEWESLYGAAAPAAEPAPIAEIRWKDMASRRVAYVTPLIPIADFPPEGTKLYAEGPKP